MEKILKNIIRLISYSDNTSPEGFILKENQFDQKSAEAIQGGSGGRPGHADTGGIDGEGQEEGASQSKSRSRSRRRIKRGGSEEEAGQEHDGGDRVHGDLEQNRKKVEQIYGLPANKDLIVRSFVMGTDPPTGGFAIFIDGLADRTTVNLLLQNLANPQLVDEVKRRISSITVDYVNDIGILEQFIEDDPYSMYSQALTTERPDRVAAFLAEGKVAIILSGSPFALVVPATMYAQLHTGEEAYLRWQYGTFLR